MKKKTLLAVLTLLASVSFCFACGSDKDADNRSREESEKDEDEEEKEEEEDKEESKPVAEKPGEELARMGRAHHMLYALDENFEHTVEVLEVYNPDNFVPKENYDWIYVDKNDREKEAFRIAVQHYDIDFLQREEFTIREIGTTSQGWSIIRAYRGVVGDPIGGIYILCGHIEGTPELVEHDGTPRLHDSIHVILSGTDFDDWTDEDCLHLVLQLFGEE